MLLEIQALFLKKCPHKQIATPFNFSFQLQVCGQCCQLKRRISKHIEPRCEFNCWYEPYQLPGLLLDNTFGTRTQTKTDRKVCMCFVCVFFSWGTIHSDDKGEKKYIIIMNLLCVCGWQAFAFSVWQRNTMTTCTHHAVTMPLSAYEYLREFFERRSQSVRSVLVFEGLFAVTLSVSQENVGVCWCL